MPKSRKVILLTYSAIALIVLAYLVYVVWQSDGGLGLIMLPVIGVLLFLWISWPATILLLTLYWKSKNERRMVLVPMFVASTLVSAASIVLWW